MAKDYDELEVMFDNEIKKEAKRCGLPDGWYPFIYERIANAVLVTGCVPKIKTRGPNKGGMNVRGIPTQQIAIVMKEK